MANPARPDDPAADPRHLLVIGAGPGLGRALAHRFAQGGYHLTLLARHTDGLAKLASDLARLHRAYDVDVVGAIVATQVAAPAMRAAGGGTIVFTSGGWADRPGPAWGTVSLGKAALRSAATMLSAGLAGDGIRVASITIAGQIQPGTPFSPDQIAEKYWSVVHSDGTWQSEFRFDGT